MEAAPRSVQALLRRTLLAKFQLRPPPQTIGDSLRIHSHITDSIAGKGKIIHYRVAICPVTKQRLPTLHVLLEDPARPQTDSKLEHIVWPGAEVVPLPEQSELERAITAFSHPIKIGETEVELDRVTRSTFKIQELMYIDS